MNFIKSCHLNLAQLATFEFSPCLTGAHQMNNRQKQCVNAKNHIIKMKKRHGHNKN